MNLILLNKWNKILKLSNISNNSNIGEITNKWFNIINEKYTEPTRFYHTTTHINELLNLEEQYSDKLKSSEIVQFSIWFHDIIYDATRHDNEEKSALLFKEFSSQVGLSDQVTNTVYEYIIATSNHNKITSAHPDNDLKYFLDMDLSILGTDPSVYQQYSDAIRKEYIHIPIEQYKQGRSKILQSFVDAGIHSLFKTDSFRDKYGNIAINNLNNEIKQLLSP